VKVTHSILNIELILKQTGFNAANRKFSNLGRILKEEGRGRANWDELRVSRF
jgi:hypothetical protein